MKIMTFNTQHCLNYIQKKIDYPIMTDVIRQFDPDIVGLNEMYNKGTDVAFEPQTAILSELTGMPYHAFAKAIDVGENNPYGNGILSKIPFSSVQTIPIPDPVPKQKRHTAMGAPDEQHPPPRHRNHQPRPHICLKPKRRREISAAFNIAVEKFMDVWYNNLKSKAHGRSNHEKDVDRSRYAKRFY